MLPIQHGRHKGVSMTTGTRASTSRECCWWTNMSFGPHSEFTAGADFTLALVTSQRGHGPRSFAATLSLLRPTSTTISDCHHHLSIETNNHTRQGQARTALIDLTFCSLFDQTTRTTQPSPTLHKAIMSTAARRRLMRDFKVSKLLISFSSHTGSLDHPNANIPAQRMQTDPPAGVSASPVPDNVMTW